MMVDCPRCGQQQDEEAWCPHCVSVGRVDSEIIYLGGSLDHPPEDPREYDVWMWAT